MSKAVIMGIQQLYNPICALLARLKVGAAMRATTAGRMPRNIAATHDTSMKRWKKRAMTRMMTNEGRAVPRVVHNAPRFLRSL